MTDPLPEKYLEKAAQIVAPLTEPGWLIENIARALWQVDKDVRANLKPEIDALKARLDLLEVSR